MPQKECEKLKEELSKYDDCEKKFLLLCLLEEYEKECRDYEETHTGNSVEVAKLARTRAEYIETLLTYDLW